VVCSFGGSLSLSLWVCLCGLLLFLLLCLVICWGILVLFGMFVGVVFFCWFPPFFLVHENFVLSSEFVFLMGNLL